MPYLLIRLLRELFVRRIIPLGLKLPYLGSKTLPDDGLSSVEKRPSQGFVVLACRGVPVCLFLCVFFVVAVLHLLPPLVPAVFSASHFSVLFDVAFRFHVPLELNK